MHKRDRERRREPGNRSEAYQGGPTESLLTFRSSLDPPFQILNLTYEFGTPSLGSPSLSVLLSIGAHDCVSSLLDWGEALREGGSPYTRNDILQQWGRCANIIKADNATGQNGFGRSGSSARTQTTTSKRSSRSTTTARRVTEAGSDGQPGRVILNSARCGSVALPAASIAAATS